MRATAEALLRAERASSIILVEGISDQVAVDTIAARLGRDLRDEGVAVIPVGGAQAMLPFLTRFGPRGAGLRVAGLCDLAEVPDVCRAVTVGGLGAALTADDLERLGFFVCDRDLEDELIRAAGRDRIEGVLVEQDDLASFRRMQKQPAWRGAGFDAQFRRFLGAGARRKSRYAWLLVEALEPADHPRPLLRLLDLA